MAYRIEFTRSALRALRRLPAPARQRVKAAVELLKVTPRPPRVVRLKGGLRDVYRVRTGACRIVYLIEDDRLVICVVRIGHRKDVYRER